MTDKPLRDDYDVVVVGGGPAGSTAGALVAEAGHSALILDREHFPRFRIGESMMPATYWTLKRLGLLEAMRRSDFPPKHSVQFFSKNGKGSAPYYFSEVDPHESSRTWQVDRAEFDEMLFRNAADRGAETVEGARVHEVLFEGERAVGVDVETEDGERRQIDSRVVVDATGQSAMLARRLGLRLTDPNLMHQSFFTRFEGAVRDEGRNAGATVILHTEEGKSWFWFIPLPEDQASVGVVAPIEYLVKGRPDDPQAVFDEELARCPALQERLEDARQVGDVRVRKDFSYYSKAIAGDGWVLVGDAFGFIDPIYSSGVFLALKGGEMAADSIVAALRADDPSGRRLGRHGPEFLAGMDAIRRMVYAFYAADFHFGRFIREYPECEEQLVHLLIGNVYREDVSDLLEAMEEFHPLPDYEPFRIEAPETGAPEIDVSEADPPEAGAADEAADAGAREIEAPQEEAVPEESPR